MIHQQLIDRTKGNLERLAKAMPEKFEIFPGTIRDKRLNNSDGDCLVHWFIFGDAMEFFADPQQEFSNSIGRIAWEAFGVYLLMEFDLGGQKWFTTAAKKRNDGELGFSAVVVDGELQSTTELSAQLEALNILIEQELPA